MGLLLNLLVLFVVLGCALWLVDALPLAYPFNQIVRVLLLLFALFWVLRMLGVFERYG